MTQRKPAVTEKPSKITIPKRCHPAARIIFAEMRRQRIGYDELDWRAGVNRTTIKAWRHNNKPGLESIQAVAGALGWEFLPLPRLENVPPLVRAKLAEAAEIWGSEDDLLGELLCEFARLPRVDRARRLANTKPVVIAAPTPKRRRRIKEAA